MTSLATIANLHHDLNRIRGIDPTDPFGRLEILDYFCEKEHEAIGERWRKFGRYGNIVDGECFEKAYLQAKQYITPEEFQEIIDWMKGQGTPDQAMAYILLTHYLKDGK